MENGINSICKDLIKDNISSIKYTSKKEIFYIDLFNSKQLKEIDVLYTYFDNETVKKMRELCLYADVITPNFTEACFLAGLPYKDASDYLSRLVMPSMNISK